MAGRLNTLELQNGDIILHPETNDIVELSNRSEIAANYVTFYGKGDSGTDYLISGGRFDWWDMIGIKLGINA